MHSLAALLFIFLEVAIVSRAAVLSPQALPLEQKTRDFILLRKCVEAVLADPLQESRHKFFDEGLYRLIYRPIPTLIGTDANIELQFLVQIDEGVHEVRHFEFNLEDLRQTPNCLTLATLQTTNIEYHYSFATFRFSDDLDRQMTPLDADKLRRSNSHFSSITLANIDSRYFLRRIDPDESEDNPTADLYYIFDDRRSTIIGMMTKDVLHWTDFEEIEFVHEA